MEVEQIKKRLNEKYNKFSVDILSKTIMEFQQLFKEKYLTTDEVIQLVILNIPKGVVAYDKVEGRYDAICSISSKEFKIEKEVLDNQDYFEYVFFHEFIHAISYRKFNEKQFMGFYTTTKGDDYEFKVRSFNEAFTEYLTLKRNKMVGYKIENGSLSGYELGALEIEMLENIIPKEKLINSYFNEPNLLENLLNECHMNIDEIFYSFKALEAKDYDEHSLEYKLALINPNNVFKIIDGERYLFYNLLDSFGKVKNEEEFNKKWSILLKEYDNKYNFYKIDGIFRIGEICSDMELLNIKTSKLIEQKISNETLNKYKFLSKIFKIEEKEKILSKLYEIYKNDCRTYFNLMRDESAVLAYTFLDNIKNSYQLYDIEMYPRVYPYLQKENAKINDVIFKKIRCEELNINFYIFDINEKNYVESNYYDIIIDRISNDEFLIKYQNQVDKINISVNKYWHNSHEFNCNIIY